jgi:Holliday junction resolvase RusA-like endonuclease
MRIKFYLDENPTITAQEKGVKSVGGRIVFYEKQEVKDLRTTYTLAIKNEMCKCRQEPPRLKGPVKISIQWAFLSSDKKNWGRLKMSKPDLDNAAKLLLDVLADLGFFEKGDQQVAKLELSKIWSDHAYVEINAREIGS